MKVLQWVGLGLTAYGAYSAYQTKQSVPVGPVSQMQHYAPYAELALGLILIFFHKKFHD